MKLRNFTPFVILWPRKYLGSEEQFKDIDIEQWSREYSWESDEWNGFKDFTQAPSITYEEKHGDCEDYAMVVLSWLKANDRDAHMLVLWQKGDIAASHVAVYDGRDVYSSGSIFRDCTVHDYVERSKYSHVLNRKV